MNTETYFTYNVTLGALIRKTIVYQIKVGAAQHRIKCEVLENKGLLSSDFQFLFTGEEAYMAAFKVALNNYIMQISD